jgi:hypothetical protein
MSARATMAEDQAAIRVEMVDEAGRPRNFLDLTATLIGPDLAASEVSLPQVGAGLYEARVDLREPGTYLVRVAAREGGETSSQQPLAQQTLGLVVPYSPEYGASASGGTDRTLLETLARRTGGGELPEPLAAFLHNLPAADRAREAWRGLLLAVALLFPLDVALRRVMLGPRDLKRAWAWVRERLPERGRAAAQPGQRALGRLFEARQRGKRRTARVRQAPNGLGATPHRGLDGRQTPTGPVEDREESPSLPASSSDEDAMARLREAKQRARRGRSPLQRD